MRSIITALSILVPIILIKAVIILFHQTCIGYDCSAYVLMLEHPDIWDSANPAPEPLLRIVTAPFMPFFATADILKALQFFAHANLAVGTYFLMQRKFGNVAAIVAVLLVSFNVLMNTYMTELIRNMLALSILPYALYFFYSKVPSLRSYTISASLFALMLFMHRSSIVFILAAIILLLYEYRASFKRRKIPLLFIIFLGAAAIGQAYMMNADEINSPENNIDQPTWSVLFLSYVWVIPPALIYKLHHDNLIKLLLIACIPSLLLLPLADFSIAQRLIIQTHLPLTYMLAVFIGMMFESRIMLSLPKRHNLILATLLLTIILAIDTPTSLVFLYTRLGF